MSFEYLNKLNKEQYQAATTIDGKVFILAGAGSGKTTVLTCRVAYMIDKGISPENILLLTFTNKAAKEMKDRVIMVCGENASKVTASTFHSFCAEFLRKNIKCFGIKNDYTILDSPDMLDAIDICRQNLISEIKKNNENYSFKDFPKKGFIGKIYEEAVNNCTTPDAVISMYACAKQYRKEILSILNDFAEYKKERNLLDYTDLLNFTYRILKENDDLRRFISNRYKYVSCDEYQDTNTIQNEILKLLASEHGNLTVVGDDNQSIYAFRCANIQNILKFDKDYPDCKSIVLDTNYRSTNEILDFSNVMMKYAKEGKGKTLKGVSNGEKPELVVVKDVFEEASYILKKIDNYHKSGYKYSDIAIISRSSRQTYLIENVLAQFNVPFEKFGGLKFMEKVCVKDILAYLRIAVNIKDEIAFYRILQLYPGIGKTYAQRISSITAKHGYNEAIEKYKNRMFYKYLLEVKNTVSSMENMSVNEQLHFLIEKYYPSVIKRNIENKDISAVEKSDALSDFEESMDDVNTLYTMAGNYKSTVAFLNDIILDATSEKDQTDKINITTIHSAKGLEYSIVFIMDCIEDVTPSCKEGDSEDNEELRCMYVAATRAKTKMYLMVPKFYNIRNFYGMLSHFINKVDILDTLECNVPRSEVESLINPYQRIDNCFKW